MEPALRVEVVTTPVTAPLGSQVRLDQHAANINDMVILKAISHRPYSQFQSVPESNIIYDHIIHCASKEISHI